MRLTLFVQRDKDHFDVPLLNGYFLILNQVEKYAYYFFTF